MAAKKIDLTKLSLEELKSLRKDVEKAIVGFQERQRSEALKELKAVAAKHGMSVEEIVGGKAKKGKAKAPAKYRNPSDANETWSGRGRQPAWYKDAVAKGAKPESMEI